MIGETMPARAAARYLGINIYQFHKLVGIEKIGVVAEVGSTPRYSTKDVQRIAANRNARPAKVSTQSA